MTVKVNNRYPLPGNGILIKKSCSIKIVTRPGLFSYKIQNESGKMLSTEFFVNTITVPFKKSFFGGNAWLLIRAENATDEVIDIEVTISA